MDINAALSEMRILTAHNADREFVSDHDTARMIELWHAIDGWLSTGGFRPAVWEVPIRQR